jgi:predicted MPP superfamily phosphohydrolase
MGVDTRHYRWGPMQYIYEECIDLYTEGQQHLYVNRGFGYLGFPGRIGVNPEITIFEMKRG